MKKSQILAALALAFALGVVAPVAGMVSTASAVTITEQGIVSSKQDIQNTVDAITSKNEYKQYKALVDALADGTDDTITVSNFTSNTTGIKSLGGTCADYKLPSEGSDVEKYQDAIDTAKACFKEEAVTGKDYSLWYNLYTAMNATTKNASETELADAIVAAARALGMTVEYDSKEDSLQDVKNEVNGTSYGTNNYGTVIGKLVDAQEQIDKINAKVTALKAALAPFVDARDIATAVDSDTPIDALEDLADDVTTNDLTSAARYNAYATLISYVKTVSDNLKGTSYNTDSTSNTDVIATLKGYYKAAAGVDLNVPGTEVIDPADPSDKPTEGDKDEEKDPAAPGTGIVSTAEGNAATTVSIVAGLATALTALGAGVVAYRNARRSSEK